MKALLGIYCLIYSAISVCSSDMLIIALMVKNEESAMQVTLQPFFAAGVQSYLVLDTGSTDKTIEVTRDLFKKYNIAQGYIVEQPFVNFETSRNYALRCVKEKFPEARFILMLDAEWIMHNVEGLVQFCKDKAQSNDSFLIRIDDGATSFFVPRLINAQQEHLFVGAIHEHLACLPQEKVPSEVFFTFEETHYGIEKSKHRAQRDIIILLEELKKNPNDARSMFYLAETYRALEDYDNAAKYYKMRTYADSVDEEERFMACYNLALIYHFNKKKWIKALYYYLKAYNIRRIRAEPLYQIALYYAENREYGLSYIFALETAQMQYPDHESHPILKKIYTFGRYDLLSYVSWHLGEYEVGEDAVRKALENHPDDAALLSNLKAYLQRKE